MQVAWALEKTKQNNGCANTMQKRTTLLFIGILTLMSLSMIGTHPAMAGNATPSNIELSVVLSSFTPYTTDRRLQDAITKKLQAFPDCVF